MAKDIELLTGSGGPLGIGLGGPLSPPTPWTPQSGAWISYPGAVTIGNPSGGQQGNGTLNAVALYINGVLVNLSNYLPFTGGTLTGTLTLNGDPVNNLDAATKHYVDSAIAGAVGPGSFITDAPNDGHNYVRKSAAWNNLDPTIALLAPLASPALTGTPTAPTVGNAQDNSTNIATTAFVENCLLAYNPTALNGGVTSNNASNAAYGIDIAPFSCADSTGTVWIRSASGFANKQTSAAWAPGSNAGGMGTGLTNAASTWYAVIAAIINGVPGVFFDTDPAGSHKPAGTTSMRRIWWIKTDSNGHIVPYKQIDDECIWTAGPYSIYTQSLGSSGGIYTQITDIMAPPNNPIGHIMYISANLTSATPAQYSSVGIYSNFANGGGGSVCAFQPNNLSQSNNLRMLCSGQNIGFGYSSSASATSVSVGCQGFFDLRGKL